MFSRSIFSNYMGSLLGLAVSKGLRFLGVIWCVRVVGNYTWGQSVSTIAVFAFLNFLVDQGLSNAPLLFRLSDHRADKRLFFLISAYRLSMAAILILIINGIHYSFHPVDPLIRIYALVLIPRALNIDWWFLRREFYQVTLYIGSARTLLFFGCVALFVTGASDARTILYIEMISETVSVLLGYLGMRLITRPSADASPAMAPFAAFGMRELLFFSLPFLLIGVLNTVQSSADILFLRYFLGNEAVALYDIGTKIGMLYFFVGASVIQIIRPKLTRLHLENNPARMGIILRTTSSMLIAFSSVFLIVSLYFSAEILGFFFKTDEALAISVFRWVAVWVGTSFMTMLCADTLLSMGRRRDYVKGAWICALSNLAANVVFLKIFPGKGAIFAKIISEGSFLIVATLWLPQNIRHEIGLGLKFQFLALTGFLAVYLITDFLDRPMWGLLLSLAGLGALLYRSRIFTRETLDVLREN